MRRLRDETRSPFARALLESVDDDRPENGACDRALGALGLGAAGVLAATTSAKAAAVVATTFVPAATATASSFAPAATGYAATSSAGTKAGIVVLVKWIGIGVLGGAVTLGSISYVRRSTHSTDKGAMASAQTTLNPSAPNANTPAERSARPSVRMPNAPAGMGDEAPVASKSATREGTSKSAEAVISPPRANVVDRSEEGLSEDGAKTSGEVTDRVDTPHSGDGVTQSEESAARDPVATQLTALSAIRAALASGDTTRALALLDALEARNPASPLAEEIAVLRIDALVDAKRGGDASALAAAFAKAYPQSAYGQHVRSKTKSP